MGTEVEELEEYRSGLHLKTNVSSFHGLETCFTNKSVDFVSWKKISYFVPRVCVTSGYEGYRMVFTSFCRDATSDHVCLASGEHFRKYIMQVASTFPIAGISRSLKRNVVVRQGNVAYTSSKMVQ